MASRLEKEGEVPAIRLGAEFCSYRGFVGDGASGL